MTDPSLESFWAACGTDGPLRLWVQDRDHPQDSCVRTFARPFALIGRDPRTDLILEHPHVSRRHAYLQVIAGRLFCVDLDSRTAMSWSGAQRHSGWIERDRPVQLGRFRIGLPPDTTDTFMPPPSNDRRGHDPLQARLVPASTEEPTPHFELAEPGAGPARCRIDRPLTLVGRSPECRLKLPDLTASRFHCALLRAASDLWVVDLLGRDGTLVNDEPVRWARLQRGDRLTVGRFHLVLRHEFGATPRRQPARGLANGAPLPSRREPVRSALRIAPSPADSAEPSPLPAATPLVLRVEPEAQPAPSRSLAPIPPTERPAHPVPVETLVAELLPETLRHAEGILAPIVHQMAQMQQQMFEQYHQSMMSMMGMFGQIHRDQSRFIERELEEIRRLSSEVRDLQEQLARDRPPAEPGPVPATTPITTTPPRPEPEPLPTKPRTEPLGPPAAETAYRDAHAQLIQRMASLQHERQSRWQSLLGRLTGTPPADTTTR